MFMVIDNKCFKFIIFNVLRSILFLKTYFIDFCLYIYYMTYRLSYDDDLPSETYGVEFDENMYLANDRYADMVDMEIMKVKKAMDEANNKLVKQHKKQNKSKDDYLKMYQIKSKNKARRKSKSRRKRKSKSRRKRKSKSRRKRKSKSK